MDLDETDVNILRVLQENGRLSFRQIADRVKVSVPTVSSKIAVMEQAGVIRGYTVFLDTERAWTYDVNKSASKSRNSPFDGRVFRGGPVATIVSGRVVWKLP